MGGDLPTYREALDAFRWHHVTDELGWSGRTTVNVAATIVDRHADGPDGGRTALIWIGESGEVRRVSFRELSQQSARFANLLARLGVRRGDRVAGLMPRVPETLTIMLGALKAGAIYVPIFTGFGRDAVRYRLQHSGARVLCTTDTQRPLVPDDMDIATICLAGSGASVVPGDYDFAAELAHESPAFAPVPCGRDEPAVIIYTSGSTGQPKGCAVATNLLAAVWPYVRYGLDLRPDDVFWPTGDPGWGYGLCCYLPALAAGVTVVSVEASPRPEVLIPVLEAHAVTNLATTPTVLRSLMASDLAASRSARCAVRAISSCGEPLNGEVVEFFRRAWTITPMDHYGATEFGLPIGNHNGIAMDVKAGSMGLPAPGCVMAIVDEEGRELPSDEVGLIAQKADADSRYWLHYWNDDAATAGAAAQQLGMHRRSRPSRPRRLLLVRGAFRRRHQERGLSHRSVRDRKRDPAPSRRGGGRRRRQAGSAPGPDREGLRRGEARSRALDASRRRDCERGQDESGAPPISARDRIHRRLAQDPDRQDPALSPAPSLTRSVPPWRSISPSSRVRRGRNPSRSRPACASAIWSSCRGRRRPTTRAAWSGWATSSAQTRAIFAKFAAVLAAAGGGLEHIVETTDYVLSLEDYARTVEVRREVFKGPPWPAATGVVVSGLVRADALIEIKGIAVLPG